MHKRDWPRVRENSIRLLALSEEEGFQMWLPLGQLFIGFAMPPKDHGAGTYRGARRFDRFAATGTVLAQSNVHAPIGEFLIAAGRAGEVVQRLDR